MKKAVFLDRDGTIVPETGAQTADPTVEPLSEAIEAVKKLRAAGFLVVVVTKLNNLRRR
jgi:histidinol phosphatase-like enzyme